MRVAQLERQPPDADRGQLRRQAEEVAGHDVHRRAHRQRRARAVLGEIERDLRAGVAGADDQHPLAREPIGVAVVPRMHDGAAKAVLVGQPFRVGQPVEAGRHHHGARPVRRARALDDEAAVLGAHARGPPRPCAARSRSGRRTPRGTRPRRRATDSAAARGRTAAPASATAASPCAGAAGRSGSATNAPATGRPPAPAPRCPAASGRPRSPARQGPRPRSAPGSGAPGACGFRPARSTSRAQTSTLKPRSTSHAAWPPRMPQFSRGCRAARS